MSVSVQGLKGSLQGYRDVRDNSPWYAQAMLKIDITAIEIGTTSWIKTHPGLPPETPIGQLWFIWDHQDLEPH